MDTVITYCDAIINSGKYALEANYFENFTSDNGENSSELIFCTNNIAGVQSNSMRATLDVGIALQSNSQRMERIYCHG